MTASSAIDQSIQYLQPLIAFPSISSVCNRDVSQWVDESLQALGFIVEQQHYQDAHGVTKVNVIGRRDPVRRTGRAAAESGGLAYFCHTDVVPVGDWTGPGGDPFTARREQNRIYGRGACDMKGSLAAMLTAAERVAVADQTAPLWIVCTADEEVGFDGAKQLVANSAAYRRIVAAQPLAIIGEPTEMQVVHAHKGIYGFEIISHGRAAHSSSTAGINSNIAMVPMLQTLLELRQQSETESRFMDHRFDPPTLSWNFGIRGGGTAINITPERTTAWVSMRPMPEIDGRELAAQAKAKAESLGLEFHWYPGGPPLWVEPDSEAVRQLCELAGGRPLTVCFGTDGGEFSELTRRVVWGPGALAQAHTSDEFIELDQLALGSNLYARAIQRWCAGGASS
jgi:acetylornithine deacetylase